MTDAEFSTVLSLPHEQRGVEFKGPGPRSNKHLLALIARAAMGMANRRDGGLVVIGVDDTPGGLVPVGLSDVELATWNHDDVAAGVNAYADPAVVFDTEVRRHDGKAYVVLRVHAFEDVPVLCKKEHRKDPPPGARPPGAPVEFVLKKGACYVRTRAKPETSEIPTQTEMRELLEFAAERRLRSFLAQAHAAGLTVAQLAAGTDDGAYDAEAEREGDGGPLRAAIRTRGHWRVSIRPERFVERRVPDVGELAPIVERCAVSFRGWPFPQPRGREVQVGVNSVWEDGDYGRHREWWRFHQSGHFVYEGGFSRDWLDQGSSWGSPGADWKPGAQLGVGDALYRLTEIYEFAARLAVAVPGDDPVRIAVTAAGLDGRELYVDDPDRADLWGEHRARIPELPLPVPRVERAALAATPRDLALDAAVALFHRFSWSASRDVLRSWQERLGRR